MPPAGLDTHPPGSGWLPPLSLRPCSVSDERQLERERASHGRCSVYISLGRFHRTLSSVSEAPEEVVAPRHRVVIFSVYSSPAVGRVRELAACLRTPWAVPRAAQGGARSPASGSLQAAGRGRWKLLQVLTAQPARPKAEVAGTRRTELSASSRSPSAGCPCSVRVRGHASHWSPLPLGNSGPQGKGLVGRWQHSPGWGFQNELRRWAERTYLTQTQNRP